MEGAVEYVVNDPQNWAIDAGEHHMQCHGIQLPQELPPYFFSDAAEMLATKWWTVQKFRANGKIHILYFPSLIHNHNNDIGLQCRGGPFTHAETECLQNAISHYQKVWLLVSEKFIVLTPFYLLIDLWYWPRRHKGLHLRHRKAARDRKVLGDHQYVIFFNTSHFIWMTGYSARALPGRSIRSVHDHVQLCYKPVKNYTWTKADDLTLIKWATHVHILLLFLFMDADWLKKSWLGLQLVRPWFGLPLPAATDIRGT